MRSARRAQIAVAVALVVALIGGIAVVARSMSSMGRTYIEAYFDNSNGLFTGDEVRILGVPVGSIDSIEPQPDQVKIRFWVRGTYKVPADVKAAILSPQLVTSRAIQLTPAYTNGPLMGDGGVIPRNHTVVPVEWDDLRMQLRKLTDALQPSQPGGVSTLGALVNTAADNLRGQGADIRDTIVKLSQAISILGDHSSDISGTVKNLSLVISALRDSASLMEELNSNLSSVSALLVNDPNEVGQAISDLNGVVADTTSFLSENSEAAGTAVDKLASISGALRDSLGDVEQALHVVPNVFQNFINVYQPAQGSSSGALALGNFANPVSWLCGAIQAASQLRADQSAKLCVQYLAPIIKNRQYNFLPIGLNPVVGAMVRPNEITYSEDWLRPDHVPAPPPSEQPPTGVPGAPLAAEAPIVGGQPVQTDPAAGLPGMMTPTAGGN